MSISIDTTFDQFIASGIITDVETVIKSGKEAVVYRCTAHPSTGYNAIAVKVYKDIDKRSFANMTDYLDGRIGRTIRKRRDILHMFSDSETMQAYWVCAEYEALKTLSNYGVPVPRPFAQTGSALAMEFIGDTTIAPQLKDVKLDRDEAQSIMTGITDAIRDMLRLDMIHGDLSPYNILVYNGAPVIIDFPQVIDARFHSQAKEMFRRDMLNVGRYFERYGFGADIESRVDETWDLYLRNKL